MNFLVWIIFGAIVGWLADTVMKSDFGLAGNIILGIVGAFVGGFLMNMIGAAGVTGFNLYSIFVAVVGAAVLIFIGRMFKR